MLRGVNQNIYPQISEGLQACFRGGRGPADAGEPPEQREYRNGTIGQHQHQQQQQHYQQYQDRQEQLYRAGESATIEGGQATATVNYSTRLVPQQIRLDCLFYSLFRDVGRHEKVIFGVSPQPRGKGKRNDHPHVKGLTALASFWDVIEEHHASPWD